MLTDDFCFYYIFSYLLGIPYVSILLELKKKKILSFPLASNRIVKHFQARKLFLGQRVKTFSQEDGWEPIKCYLKVFVTYPFIKVVINIDLENNKITGWFYSVFNIRSFHLTMGVYFPRRVFNYLYGFK